MRQKWREADSTQFEVTDSRFKITSNGWPQVYAQQRPDMLTQDPALTYEPMTIDALLLDVLPHLVEPLIIETMEDDKLVAYWHLKPGVFQMFKWIRPLVNTAILSFYPRDSVAFERRQIHRITTVQVSLPANLSPMVQLYIEDNKNSFKFLLNSEDALRLGLLLQQAAVDGLDTLKWQQQTQDLKPLLLQKGVEHVEKLPADSSDDFLTSPSASFGGNSFKRGTTPPVVSDSDRKLDG